MPNSQAARIMFWTAIAAANLGSPMLSTQENFELIGGTITAIARGARERYPEYLAYFEIAFSVYLSLIIMNSQGCVLKGLGPHRAASSIL